MTVVTDLREAKFIIEKLRKRKDSEQLTGYSEYSLDCIIRSLDRVVERYGRESKRVREVQLRNEKSR